MQKEITISKEKIYKGHVISLEVNKVKCPNDVLSTREIVRHPGGVCILAEINGKIIMEKQYRAPFDDFIIELPAGKLNKNEDIKEAAIRELEEEVGYKAQSIKYVGNMYPSVGYTDEIIHLFYTNDLMKTKTNFDVDENIEIVYYTKDEISKMLRDNLIKDAKSIILLFKYLYGDLK